ncbi:hypothetical protein GCM10027062_16650 [Nocardioides hungaricus]
MRILALPLVLTVSLIAPGCAPSGCSDVGGIDGIAIAIPASLFVRSGTVEIEVCDDDGCVTATQSLGRVPDDRPVGRAVNVVSDALSRTLAPGPVDVTAELTSATGALVAVTSGVVDLERYYPNGKACDGYGYVTGSLRMRGSDRVDPAVR